MILQDLIFTPINIHCPKCHKLIDTSIEELQDNDEVTCQDCGFVFKPNVNVGNFLNLLKRAEETDFSKLKNSNDEL